MPRRLRDTSPGIFHVYTHASRSSNAFEDDLDRVVFLRELARATKKTWWRCLAFCLMTTHYHLILDVEQGTLPVGMQALNFRYASAFNARHRTRGHVFAARYDSRRINDDPHLMTAYRYLAWNPVKAYLCDSPVEWPWSSYAGVVDRPKANTFVDSMPILACFGGEPEIALGRLRAFVETA